MIRRASKLILLSSIVAFAAHANAGPSVVTPAFAACSKALVETLAKNETLPTYTLRAPSGFVSDLVDPHSFTVFAKDTKTQALLAKASCRATPSGQILSFKAIPLKS